MRTIKIFDTTLRDGEQCPGASMNAEEKLEVAHQLARLRVEVIEAGFPISSPGDFASVQQIAREVRGPVIAALARVRAEDIDAAGESVRDAERPRIHTFVGTSEIHLKYQMRKSREEVLEMAVAAVRHAKGYVEDVEFSPMDASRTDPDYLCQIVEATIKAGATTINIPDTVGYATRELNSNRPGDRSLVKCSQLIEIIAGLGCENDLEHVLPALSRLRSALAPDPPSRLSILAWPLSP